MVPPLGSLEVHGVSSPGQRILEQSILTGAAAVTLSACNKITKKLATATNLKLPG